LINQKSIRRCPLFTVLLIIIYRDFGYIARDQSTRRYKCHVFRCQVPAHAVARALVENHNKERMKKSSDNNIEHAEPISPHIGGGGVFNEGLSF